MATVKEFMLEDILVLLYVVGMVKEVSTYAPSFRTSRDGIEHKDDSNTSGWMGLYCKSTSFRLGSCLSLLKPGSDNKEINMLVVICFISFHKS